MTSFQFPNFDSFSRDISDIGYKVKKKFLDLMDEAAYRIKTKPSPLTPFANPNAKPGFMSKPANTLVQGARGFSDVGQTLKNLSE